MNARPGDRPQVIAHRGGTETAAEHTLAGYAHAVQAGADGLECDVRLTRDGVPVCVHDRRIDRTSNGRGVLSTIELARLTELDFAGSHPARAAAEVPDRDRAGVLTLARLLELLEAQPRPVDLAIETKHPTRYAGLVEHRVLQLLDRFGRRQAAPAPGQVRIMSFSATSLRRVRALAPDLEIVRLFNWWPAGGRGPTLPASARVAGPSIRLLRRHPDYVRWAHARGHAVHVWTVDSPEDIRLCADLGVDAIITNRPVSALAQLAG